MKLGVLAGSVIRHGGIEFDGSPGKVSGRPSSGIFEVASERGSLHIIARHGSPPFIPPHMIDHRANLRSLIEVGVEAVLSVCSCGALRRELPVPCWAVPDDFIDLVGGHTFMDDRIEHITPGIDARLSGRLVLACRKAGEDVISGGIYVQTRGPRLETKAEIRLISGWGDYVGMNMAPEAVLAMEAGLPYSALLTVDNYANGIGAETLDYMEILRNARISWERSLSVLKGVAEGPRLGASDGDGRRGL